MIELWLTFTIAVLIAAAAQVVVSAILSLQWFPSLLVLGGYNPSACQLIAMRLSDSIENGTDLALTAVGCHSHVDRASARRLRLFSHHLAEGASPQQAIQRARLLPAPQRRLIGHLARADIRLLARLLKRYAAGIDRDGGISPALAAAGILAPIACAMLAWLAIVIIPKFEQIFIELAIELPTLSTWVIAVTNTLLRLGALSWLVVFFAVLALLALPRACAWWWHGWQPLGRSIERAKVLLDGTALGLPEAALGQLIAHRPPALCWRDYCKALGFAAGTPEELSSEIRLQEQRLNLRIVLLRAVASIMLWMLLAAIIGLIIAALFLPLITILSHV